MPKYTLRTDSARGFTATLRNMEHVTIQPVLSYTEDRAAGTLEVEGENEIRTFLYKDLAKIEFLEL
jgi:hypothetical protein